MDFQRIFGTAFRYPIHLKIFIIIFVFSLFMTVPPVFYAPSGRLETVQELFNFFNFMVPFWIISFFVGSFLAALFYDSASRYYPKMKYGNIKESLSTAKKRYVPLLGTQILLFFMVAVVFAAFLAGPFILILLGVPSETLLLVGILLGISSLVLMVFFLFLGPFVCVLDGLGPFDSLKKSYYLVKGNKMNTFVFWLILLFVVLIISFLGSLPSSVYAVMGGGTFSSLGMVLVLFQVILSSYSVLFAYSANVNFYTTLKGSVKVPVLKSAITKSKPKPKAKPKSKKKPARKRKK